MVLLSNGFNKQGYSYLETQLLKNSYLEPLYTKTGDDCMHTGAKVVNCSFGDAGSRDDLDQLRSSVFCVAKLKKISTFRESICVHFFNCRGIWDGFAAQCSG